MSYHTKTFFIQTFGCAANVADSERLESVYLSRGYKKADSIYLADDVVINTCMIRQMAEDRVYGLINNLKKKKLSTRPQKIIVTGCMVGMIVRDKTGKLINKLKQRMPEVDEFLPIEEVGFDFPPVRSSTKHALIPISNGCNNFCTYCVVPFSRGREISRPFDEIIKECQNVASCGYEYITLIGQNVNSYGSDLLLGEKNIHVLRDLNQKKYFRSSLSKLQYKSMISPDLKNIRPTYVKHLGRLRIPTLFPELLSQVAKIKSIKKIDFISSNPWDFSTDLIKVIKNHINISRQIHLPVQSGDDEILAKMNRWYTSDDYLNLVKKIKQHIPDVSISTDIMVGFCHETEEQFQNTLKLCKSVKFSKAYISMYSDRPMTAAHKAYQDDVPYSEKKRRWRILEELINIPNLYNFRKNK